MVTSSGSGGIRRCFGGCGWLGHQAPVGAVACTLDGKTILSGSEDQTVRLWDAGTGKEKGILQGGTGYVVGLAHTPDGKSIISTGINPTALAAWTFPPALRE